jgi:hypothetical protein
MKVTAQIVGAVVEQLRVGKANARPGRVIADRLGLSRLRTVQEAIRFERARRYRAHEPQIAGDGSGYWIVEGAGELERPRRANRRRALASLETCKWLDPEVYRVLEAQGVLALFGSGGVA